MSVSKRPVIVLLVIAALAVATWWFNARALSEQFPPTLTMTAVDGRALRAADLREKVVLVNFWATTCAVCLEEIPELTSLYDARAPDLELISVAMPYDMPARVVTLAQQLALNFPVVLDVTGEIGRAFGGVNATPTVLLFDRNGDLQARATGEHGARRVREQARQLLDAGSEASASGDHG